MEFFSQANIACMIIIVKKLIYFKLNLIFKILIDITPLLIKVKSTNKNINAYEKICIFMAYVYSSKTLNNFQKRFLFKEEKESILFLINQNKKDTINNIFPRK